MRYIKTISIMVALLVLALLAILVYAGDGSTAFIIRNASGTDVATFYSNGTVEFLSRCACGEGLCTVNSGESVQISACVSAPSNSFQINSDKFGDDNFWISNDGVLCTNGIIIQDGTLTGGASGRPMLNISSPNGEVNITIGGGADLLTTSKINCGTCGADCGAGVCSGLGICDTAETCDNDNDCISGSCTASTCT